MPFSAIIKNGEMKMSNDYTRQAFKKFLANHDGSRIEFVPVTPESKKQRGMFEGAYVPLWAYLDGKDHKDREVLEAVREIAKIEFNGDFMVINGVSKKYGKSTKQKLNDGFMNRMLDYLVEQYAINPLEVLNPTEYKKWRDEVYPWGRPDNYIDYLVEIGLLKKI